MVEPDVIRVPRCPTQALDPPFISLRLHHIPAVKRIAPTLTRLAEEIRRYARDHCGLEIFIQSEQIAVHPDVGAIVIYEDGDVAYDADFVLRTVTSQCLPLFVKSELQGAANLQVRCQFLASLPYRPRSAPPQFRSPFIPACRFSPRAQRIKQNK